jgi:hypothetical protein
MPKIRADATRPWPRGSTLKLGLKVSGSDYLSSDLAAPASAAVVKHVFDLNPYSGQIWTKEAVDVAVALLQSGST